MTIRDASEADLPAIVEIYNTAIPGRLATADTEPVSVNSRRTWFSEHDPDRRPLWVASFEAAISGWLSFQSFYGRPAYHATAEISVYVTPSRHRTGIGNALLAKAIEASPQLGLKTLVGFIFGHNEIMGRMNATRELLRRRRLRSGQLSGGKHHGPLHAHRKHGVGDDRRMRGRVHHARVEIAEPCGVRHHPARIHAVFDGGSALADDGGAEGHGLVSPLSRDRDLRGSCGVAE